MILDHMDNQMGDDANHMMDWWGDVFGPGAWIFMILGFVIFLIIVIVLVYILNRGQHLVEKQPSLQTQPNKTLKDKDRVEENTQEKNQFCSYCGATLQDKAVKYCPNCGNEIKTNKR